MRGSDIRAAYVHVPFCVHRCGYCNFTVVANRSDLVDDYLRAIEQELSWLKQPRPVTTLFLGGGTPTQLPPDKLQHLLNLLAHWFPLADDGELSIEANPADIDANVIATIAGRVNRLSLGAQSFDSDKLALLERDHGAEQICRSVELARPVVQSLSLDLIFGVPDETRATWSSDIDQALQLPIDHVSTYGLTFEKGTQFWTRLSKNQFAELDEEDSRWMYLAAIEALSSARFEHYEVSNFARPGHRCRHNETYWAGDQYYAVGPGAASYVDGQRRMNHRSTTTYLKRVLNNESPVAETERLSPEDRAREQLVFGLRRMNGVDVPKFERQTGFKISTLVGDALQRHLELQFLALNDDRLRLTREGLLVSDSIWPDFLQA